MGEHSRIYLFISFVLKGELAKENGASEFIWEEDPEARSKLWHARHEWYYAGLALEPGKQVIHVHTSGFIQEFDLGGNDCT